jgi:hypothetical protein
MNHVAVLLAMLAVACAGAPQLPPAAPVEPPRELGSWKGKGSTTLGFVSESGSFRIHWKSRNQDAGRPGVFELTLRSGISGRPMQLIADHRGDGEGSVEFGDDPRLYEFLVESTGIDWWVSVEETFAPRP